MHKKYFYFDYELEEFYEYLRVFIHKNLKTHFLNTESIVSEKILETDLEKCKEIGIIPSSEQEETGIWNSHRLDISLLSLILLGEINGSLGYLAHKFSLYYFIRKRFSLNEIPNFFLHIQGIYGLGRYSLIKFILNRDINKKEDQKILYEYFQPPSHLQIPGFLKFILLPFLDFSKNEISLNLYKIQNQIPENPSHGLEEISCFEIEIEKEFQKIPIARKDFIKLLNLEILALISIATGRLIFAFKKAIRYTNERVQGGKLIYHYPAIQDLLFTADSIIQISLNSLLTLKETDSISLLAQILRIKKTLMPLIVEGISHCLQTFGGYGYMRDYGIEKAYRDANQLSKMMGTSYEISLVLSELEKELNLGPGVSV